MKRICRFALRLALLLPRVLLYGAYLACDLAREVWRAAVREWADTAAAGQERTDGRTNEGARYDSVI